MWVALNENVKTSKDIVDNYRKKFESRISAGATEKMPETKATGKSDAETISSWSCDIEGHAKKCVERYCELANKTTQQFLKVATPCIDDHQFKEEEIGSVGELSKVCAQIVLKCLYLTRIGRLHIWWAVNKLARAAAKWTNACDKRLARLISYIVTQVNSNNMVMWETQHTNADWDYSKIQILPVTWKIRNQRRVESYAFSEVTRSCQQVGCARNSLQFLIVQRKLKIMSLDAGLRYPSSGSLEFGYRSVPLHPISIQ